jgi:iron complex outermembrane receptor protein
MRSHGQHGPSWADASRKASARGHTVSARCFNSSAANKLLVLVDGRSVYSPLFSGVFWDVQEAMLEELIASK